MEQYGIPISNNAIGMFIRKMPTTAVTLATNCPIEVVGCTSPYLFTWHSGKDNRKRGPLNSNVALGDITQRLSGFEVPSSLPRANYQNCESFVHSSLIGHFRTPTL